MTTDDLLRRVRAWLDGRGAGDMPCATGLAGLTVLQSHKPTLIEAGLYQPLLCLILQGSKETCFGTRCLRFSAGESLIVSHHLPVRSRVAEASDEVPYVALVLELDLGLVRSLYDEVGDADLEARHVRGFDVGETSVALIDALGRLFDLVDRPPLEATVMAPIVLREIHFRLLLASHGGMLRQLLQRGSHANRITRAIAHIKQNYATPLTVNSMARIAGMSPSSFHDHFKALTATTPLQYQKELRLLEARRLLMDAGHTVATAAFKVGYESPTQFSREYARKFGNPPRIDRARVEDMGSTS